MTSTVAPSLDDLRRRIDAIDDGLLDLIQERAAIVGAIAAAKRASGSAGAFRPGREAQVMRRLASQLDGPFGVATMVRLWREIMCEFTRLQGPFSAAVDCAPDRCGLWDLARDHFGAETPLAAHGSAEAVIGAVAAGAATVGVLAPPSAAPAGAWWPRLRSADRARVRIISRLPFASPGSARGPVRDAVAVACLPTEPSGHDRSFLAVPAAGPAEAADLLHTAGLAPYGAAVAADGAVLAEVDGYLDDADPRLARLPSGTLVLGAYAVPLAESGGARG
ncbi:chorismate mutase [Stella sp.]|uniref:chorismate mutase n=1 Tax=Stella sp. TaxID=2912054 RepID=UPI0035B05714